MAANVFGREITEKTVRELPEYKDPNREISPWDLSKVALDMSHAENKVEEARAYLAGQVRSAFNDGICTKVLIYNATGATMTFIRSHDWNGHLGESPYPTEIGNGQWAALFHQRPAFIQAGSEGAVVYRLQSPDSAPTVDCMISWSTPWGVIWFNNKCYAEIREPDHFDDTVWRVVEYKMGKSGRQVEEKGELFVAEVTTGVGSTPECQATVKLIPLSPAFDLMNE